MKSLFFLLFLSMLLFSMSEIHLGCRDSTRTLPVYMRLIAEGLGNLKEEQNKFVKNETKISTRSLRLLKNFSARLFNSTKIQKKELRRVFTYFNRQRSEIDNLKMMVHHIDNTLSSQTQMLDDWQIFFQNLMDITPGYLNATLSQHFSRIEEQIRRYCS